MKEGNMYIFKIVRNIDHLYKDLPDLNFPTGRFTFSGKSEEFYTPIFYEYPCKPTHSTDTNIQKEAV